jgi:hypothetical protein
VAERDQKAREVEALSGDGPLAQVKKIWNKLDLVDRRLFIDHVLRAPLKKALAECGGDAEAVLEHLAVYG